MLKILTIPHKVLISPVKPVTSFDAKLKKLVVDMEETLINCVDPQGVGLAAPQVGVSSALFIVKPDPHKDTKVFVNPKILKSEPHFVSTSLDSAGGRGKKNQQLEGCLSIPRIWGPVKRADKVLLEYQDIDGTKHEQWFTKMEATIIQHEVDHLQGILFTQRSIEQNSPLYEEKDDEFVPVKY